MSKSSNKDKMRIQTLCKHGWIWS